MGSLSEYACPLCGRKVKDHLGKDCLFVHDSEVGAIICGFCKSDIIKMKRKSDNIEEFKRRLADFNKPE